MTCLVALSEGSELKKIYIYIFAYVVWREREREYTFYLLEREREKENIASTCLVCKRKKKRVFDHYTLMDIFNNF